jgi:hypothetical protein
VPESVHPDDRDRLREKFQASLSTTGKARFEDEHRVVLPDGSTRWLLVRGRTFFKGRGRTRRAVRATGTAIDITDRKMVELQNQELTNSLEQQVAERVELFEILRDIAIASNEASSVEEAVGHALQRICEYNHWIAGHVYRNVDGDSNLMVSSGIWCINDEAVTDLKCRTKLLEYQQLATQQRFRPGEGLVGQVLESAKPCWIEDVSEFDAWQRGDADNFGLAAAIAFPVMVNGEVTAVLECYSDRKSSAYLTSLRGTLGRQPLA